MFLFGREINNNLQENKIKTISEVQVSWLQNNNAQKSHSLIKNTQCAYHPEKIFRKFLKKSLPNKLKQRPA